MDEGTILQKPGSGLLDKSITTRELIFLLAFVFCLFSFSKQYNKKPNDFLDHLEDVLTGFSVTRKKSFNE